MTAAARQQDHLPVAPVLAQLADAEPLLALREAAAAWLAARGIRQWEPGEVTLRQVEGQVAAGEPCA